MLEAAIQQYGAKGAVLQYIKETDSSIPIEPFVLVGVGEHWKEREKEIRSLGNALVRSSSPLEDGQRLSWAGIFATKEFKYKQAVDDVLLSVNSFSALKYAAIHKVQEDITMGLLFQRKSASLWNWSLLRHPHRDNIIFIQGRPNYDLYISENIFFDAETNNFYRFPFRNRNKSLTSGELLDHTEVDDDILKAIENYKRIEMFPAFHTGFTYQMEFGTRPFSVYQFRPFRKRETASWQLSTSKKEGESAKETDFCFGITPPEGLELNVVRGLTAGPAHKFIDYFRTECKDLPSDEGIEKLARYWGLTKEERAYAEQVATIPAEADNFWDYFDAALSILNKRANKDSTCLLQSLSEYGSDNIDLVFPNARAIVTGSAHKFLSHHWFRALQHYDVSLLMYHQAYETGTPIRVFSDGLHGRVEVVK